MAITGLEVQSISHIIEQAALRDAESNITRMALSEGRIPSTQEVSDESKSIHKEVSEALRPEKNIDTWNRARLQDSIEHKIENTCLWDKYVTIGNLGEEAFTVESITNANLLNGELPSNSKIIIKNKHGDNTITVHTDNLSRPRLYDVSQVTKTDGTRDIYQQYLCNFQKDGFPTDDAGHILAREFGGPCEQINLMPMDSHTNRYGEWRLMEKDIGRALDHGDAVTDFKTEIVYDGTSKRPLGFEVSYKNNGSTVYEYIDNTARGA